MHIGGEGVENLLVNMVLKFIFLKRYKLEKTPSHASLLWNGLNRF
jgi:hypothetical protein